MKGWKKQNSGWRNEVIYSSRKKTYSGNMPKVQIIAEKDIRDKWIVGKRTFGNFGFTKSWTKLKGDIKNKSEAVSYARNYIAKSGSIKEYRK